MRDIAADNTLLFCSQKILFFFFLYSTVTYVVGTQLKYSSRFDRRTLNSQIGRLFLLHEVLMVSYCSQSMSIVHCAVSTIALKAYSSYTPGPIDLILGMKHQGDL